MDPGDGDVGPLSAAALPGAARQRSATDPAAAFGFEGCGYDALFNVAIIHYLEDWRLALTEVARVLRPGGWFFFVGHIAGPCAPGSADVLARVGTNGGEAGPMFPRAIPLPGIDWSGEVPG